MSSKKSFASMTVHAGRRRDTISHCPPIDLSTTCRIFDLPQAIDSIDALNRGDAPTGNPIYSRLHGENVACFERAIAELEGGKEAVAFASGMAAIAAVLLDVQTRGGHVIACRPLYGGTDSLLNSGILSISQSWCTPENISNHIQDHTALIWIETPANPTLNLVDIKAVVEQARDIPVVVDSTFATPMLQQPLQLGASMVIHSASKFIGGHSDVLAGVVVCDQTIARRLRKIRVYTGGVLHPLSGYLLHRGLQTLHLRMAAAQDNAIYLVEKLLQHPAISQVFHPSLAHCDPKGLVGRQMSGPGALMSFECAGGFSVAEKLMQGLKLITPAVSLGSVDSLIQHPAGLTHRNISAEARKAAGISDGMLRLSVGVEDKKDLWADIKQALP